MRPLILMIVLAAITQTAAAQVTTAQKLDVKIIDRQDSATGYTYVAPAYFNSQSNSNVNCYGDVTCNASTTTTGSISPPRKISYQVRGATFTLQLPDGRAAVVNCESKYTPRFDYINRRDCRMPLVENIQAEFHGDKAKLTWVVSLDGKKTQSETYKVLAILDKPNDEAYQDLKANGPRKFDQSSPASAAPQDVFVWFDESAPAPGAPLFEVVVTARAYDGALAILRQARQGNTSVQSGTSVLDSNYHPSTVSLDSWQKSNQNSAPSLFYWKGEEVNGATPVTHFQMTKRAYEQMLALVAGSDLRVRPSQTSNQNHTP
jgi:hypothetical protein